MNEFNPNIGPSATVPSIVQLPDTVINQIAAGEVVERPASAVKELVENAIDAGASRIEVAYAQGGKALIRVTDDGVGMTPAQLPLALARHATSKIDGTDLLNIQSFGFRGEALASMAAVARLSIETATEGGDPVEIRCQGGALEPVKPPARRPGTTVTLRDLFYATPARLKFLRSDRAEAQAIGTVIKRLAMAEPQIGFTLRDLTQGGTGRVTFRADPETGDMFDALQSRLSTILGREFTDNAIRLDSDRDGMRLTGYAALPTYSRGAAVAQYLFVNGRPVQDKLLLGALRAAYRDVLSRDRHPAACLFLELDPQRVDVNVHPAKAELRFREPGLIRGFVLSTLRHALAEAGHRASGTVGQDTLASFRQPVQSNASLGYTWQAPQAPDPNTATQPMRGFAEANRLIPYRAPPPVTDPSLSLDALPSARSDSPEPTTEEIAQPLGAARAQLHGCYIVSQTETGMILVDMHAAHERLVYERLKAQRAEHGIASQALLIPDIVDLGDGAERLLALASELAKLGLGLDPFGPGTVAVRETPALLGQVNSEALLRDLLDELDGQGDTSLLETRIDAILSRIACHGSIRSGREMRADEMNALLREMEATPLSGQCNHGRPTYVSLSLTDLERLFGRS